MIGLWDESRDTTLRAWRLKFLRGAGVTTAVLMLAAELLRVAGFGYLAVAVATVALCLLVLFAVALIDILRARRARPVDSEEWFRRMRTQILLWLACAACMLTAAAVFFATVEWDEPSGTTARWGDVLPAWQAPLFVALALLMWGAFVLSLVLMPRRGRERFWF